MFSSQMKVLTSISDISALFNFEINHHSKTSITEEIFSKFSKLFFELFFELFSLLFSEIFSFKKFHNHKKIFLSS
jgi:hypothetical protein